MSAEQNKALIRRYLDDLSGKDKPAALVNQYVAEVDDALRQHIADAEAAFPRYELVAEDIIAEGDKVVVRFSWRGTHQDEFMGMPATGNRIDVPGIIIYRVSDGQIVEHWIHVDAPTMMRQLGMVPQPA